MLTKIIMPQLGESVVEGTISRWLKNEGDSIDEMESLLEVSTDKVDTEIPSPAGGVLLKIVIPAGETVNAGTIIAWIGQPGESIPGDLERDGKALPAHGAGNLPEGMGPGVGAPAQGQNEAPPGIAPPPLAPGRNRELGFISPIVARLAQENQVDLSRVPGTGEGGRITKKDVLAHLEQQPAPAQVEEAAAWETPGEGDLFRPTEMVFGQGAPGLGKTEPDRPAEAPQPAPEPAVPGLPGDGVILPLSNMRRRIAEHMVMSKRTAPHVTTVMEADLQRVVAHYQAQRAAFARDGVKLTYTAYFVSAVVSALRAFPLVNSSWTDEGIRVYPRVGLGLAVSLEEAGLIVPVLKDAEGLSLLGLARAIADIAGRARANRLSPEDVRGGTFTITNHGISGSLFATPVINQPQCGILGVGAIQKRVVVIENEAAGDSIAIRPMVYLSFTFDHRILDGALADGFLAKVVQQLENWQ